MTSNVPATKKETVPTLLQQDIIQKRFKDVLKEKTPGFVSSLLSLVNNNKGLAECMPRSVLSAALIAASMDLPINPNLGFAYIVPYKSKTGAIAQFQMGWKGFVQLAMRTGLYKTIHCSEVYEGQIKSINNFTGEIEFDPEGRFDDKVVGYCAYFKTINGFEKYLYMTTKEVTAHGKKYSQAFKKGYGPWVDDYPSMALKTVLKRLLSKYGMLSIEMQGAKDMIRAIRADQAEITDEGDLNFVDNPDKEVAPIKPKTEKPKRKRKSVKPVEPVKENVYAEPKTEPQKNVDPPAGYQGTPEEQGQVPKEDKYAEYDNTTGSIKPKTKSILRNLLQILDMTEKQYFRNTAIENLSERAAQIAKDDISSQIDEG